MGVALSANVNQSVNYTNISASGLVRTGPGSLLGIFVASGASPTIKVWDNTSAATTILVNTFTPNVASFHPMPGAFQTGLYITIGGTCDCTVFWGP